MYWGWKCFDASNKCLSILLPLTIFYQRCVKSVMLIVDKNSPSFHRAVYLDAFSWTPTKLIQISCRSINIILETPSSEVTRLLERVGIFSQEAGEKPRGLTSKMLTNRCSIKCTPKIHTSFRLISLSSQGKGKQILVSLKHTRMRQFLVWWHFFPIF